jgi:hypothetical protein
VSPPSEEALSRIGHQRRTGGIETGWQRHYETGTGAIQNEATHSRRKRKTAEQTGKRAGSGEIGQQSLVARELKNGDRWWESLAPWRRRNTRAKPLAGTEQSERQELRSGKNTMRILGALMPCDGHPEQKSRAGILHGKNNLTGRQGTRNRNSKLEPRAHEAEKRKIIQI